MSWELSRQATRDIRGLSRYIERDSPRAAVAMVSRLTQVFHALAAMPGMGRSRDDLRPQLRSFPAEGYIIVYRERPGGILILRVLHGARAWERLV